MSLIRAADLLCSISPTCTIMDILRASEASFASLRAAIPLSPVRCLDILNADYDVPVLFADVYRPVGGRRS